MQEDHALTVAKTTSPEHASEVVLRTYDLTKHYGARRAVDRLNLEIRHSEIVGFLGPNGAGKTTTIRLILGLISPIAGRVELFGRDLATEQAWLLPRIGALVETPALYLHLTGRENLRPWGQSLAACPASALMPFWKWSAYTHERPIASVPIRWA